MRLKHPSCITSIEGTDIIEELHSKFERKEVIEFSSLFETNLLLVQEKKLDTKSY